MITVDEVVGLIRHELRSKLPSDKILDEGTQLSDLGLSSLQTSDIVFTLEEHHMVEFDASQAADVKTIGDVVSVANAALAEKRAQVA